MVDTKQVSKREALIEFLRKVDMINRTQFNAVSAFLDKVDQDHYYWFKLWYSRSEHFSEEELNLCSFMRNTKFVKVWDSFAAPFDPKLFFSWIVLYKFHGVSE